MSYNTHNNKNLKILYYYGDGGFTQEVVNEDEGHEYHDHWVCKESWLAVKDSLTLHPSVPECRRKQ